MTIQFHIAKKVLIITDNKGLTAWVKLSLISKDDLALAISPNELDKIKALWSIYRTVSSRHIHFSHYVKLNLLVSKYTNMNLGSMI